MRSMAEVLDQETTRKYVDAAAGSLLVDRQIKELCAKGMLISSGYREENVESISYNLTIDEIIRWNLKEDAETLPKNEENLKIESKKYLQLFPKETVFVRMAEHLKIPKNVVGRIVERNSLMRIGLLVTGPQYQPGHNTDIFLRVCNLSDYDITLQRGDSIAQISFEVLGQTPDKSYGTDKDDRYQGEDNFAIPVEIQKHITETSDLQKKMDNLEARIYTVVAAFIGAFVSVLSLLVVNFSALEGKSVEEIVVVNISLAVCITIILGMVLLFCKAMTGSKSLRQKKSRQSRRKR